MERVLLRVAMFPIQPVCRGYHRMSAGTLTAEEFAQRYAKNSGITVERLFELGRVVSTCDCDEEGSGCEGFQMIAPDLLESYQSMGRPWVQVLP